MTTEDPARQVHDELAAALEAVAEHARVSARLDRARRAEESAREAAVRAHEQLAVEARDVRALADKERLLTEAGGTAGEELGRVAGEAASARAAVVSGLSVDGLTRAFDVWFDNIFTDWSVKSRITDAARRTDEAAGAVHEIRTRLAGQERELAARIAELAVRRERLLLEATA